MRAWVCLFVLLAGGVSASLDTRLRVNEAGYVLGASKFGYLQTASAVKGEFSLVNVQSNEVQKTVQISGSPNGKWNSYFPDVYVFNFSDFDEAGVFKVVAKSSAGSIVAESMTFPIGPTNEIYARLLNNTLFFYQTNRDGEDVNSFFMERQASHLTDKSATLYYEANYFHGQLSGSPVPVEGHPPVDVEGGWFDAGDYVKFVETASYTVTMMLASIEEYGTDQMMRDMNLLAEAKHGLKWLAKMWNSETKTLYYQVGVGDGNKHIIGDHDLWRLPQDDDALNIQPGDTRNEMYYIKYRPVFQAGNGNGGENISPNLVGRMAAAFALGSQVFNASDPDFANTCLKKAKEIYPLATTSDSTCELQNLLSVSPGDYYPEEEWCSDMELGADALYRATGESNYLDDARKFASQYVHYFDETDYFNLYDVGALAHYRLYKTLSVNGSDSKLRQQLLSNMKNALQQAQSKSNKDVYKLGFSYSEDLDAVPEFLGLSALGYMYQDLTSDKTYEELTRRQIDYVLGANGWASSFIVGSGYDPAGMDPHCMQHQVANLVGSLDGTPPKVYGSLVDGPTMSGNVKNLDGLPDGGITCADNQFGHYNRGQWAYKDDARAWASSEPACDYVAMSVFVFARVTGRGY